MKSPFQVPNYNVHNRKRTTHINKIQNMFGEPEVRKKKSYKC